MRNDFKIFLGTVLFIFVSSFSIELCANSVFLGKLNPESGVQMELGPRVLAIRNKIIADRDEAEKTALRSMGEGEEYVEEEFAKNVAKKNKFRELSKKQPYGGGKALRDSRLPKVVVDVCSDALIRRGICPDIVELGCCKNADAFARATIEPVLNDNRLCGKKTLDAGSAYIEFSQSFIDTVKNLEQSGVDRDRIVEFILGMGIEHEITHIEQADALIGVLLTRKNKVDPKAFEAFLLQMETVAELLPSTNHKWTAGACNKAVKSLCVAANINPQACKIDTTHLHPREVLTKSNEILKAWEDDEAEADGLTLYTKTGEGDFI